LSDPAKPAAPSLMAVEAAEAPAVVARQIADSGAAFAALGERLRRAPPPVVVTCARGSSDHAALYGKHVIETTLGCPVASVGPSVASVYGVRPAVRGALFVAVSQSGRSPDLLRLTEAARDGGALVVGFVNDMTSPLPELCEVAIPLAAGAERSVAATKSCLAAMAGLLQLAAQWSQDAALLDAVRGLPELLAQALGCDWGGALAPLARAAGLYVVGRGPGFGVACEMALKLKETCRLHGEAFSAAEVVHGPLALVGPDFPVLAVSQPDAAAPHTEAVVRRMAAMGAPVWLAGTTMPGASALPVPKGAPAATLPLAALLSFYRAVDGLARARGLDPDRPPHLSKVTETV